MAYLLRRQLKTFSTSPAQRTLVFPSSFSSRDRFKLHVMAESWGFMHESHGEGARRKLVVWKPSRGMKSLKPAMLEGWSSSGGSEGEEQDAEERESTTGAQESASTRQDSSDACAATASSASQQPPLAVGAATR